VRVAVKINRPAKLRGIFTGDSNTAASKYLRGDTVGEGQKRTTVFLVGRRVGVRRVEKHACVFRVVCGLALFALNQR